MDINWDDYLEVPLKWLETIIDYLPEWPPSWLPDSPPDWLIDLVEKYAPNLPSTYFSDLFHLGLPHFYVQQNVCEKAFDIGVLILTFGTLILIVLLLRRCLSTEASRSRERWVCYECRAEKSEVLSEDLVHVEKKVETLKNACQNVNKKLQGCIQGQGIDGPALEKRMKKLPQILLSNTMLESSIALGETSVFGNILNLCGKVQKLLGNEVLEYEIEVEKSVINKQLELLEIDVPNIVKQRKHLAKLILDMDSAKTRYQTAARHSLQTSGTNAAKADVIKEEMDDASMKVEQCRDLLVGDMFSLISKESELAHHFVHLVKCQAEYHKKALNILDSYTNCMEDEIRNSQCRPVYGCLLEEHLKINERQIAVPIEICIYFLMEYGLHEEGLFRVAGSASKVKKLKASFDANISFICETHEFIKDPHTVAGALKSYLRELPNPLMTYELYNEWIQAGRITDTETRLQSLRAIVQKLPVPYFNNLRFLMKFLNKLAADQDINKMTAQNLAIVIAPNLIWAPEEGSAALGLNMSLANTYSLIVDNLITKADWLFPGDVEFCLPSPILRSPHDLHQSSHSTMMQSLDFDMHQVNGEMEVHPSLLGVDSNNLNYNQQSPLYGGSPKSLRRNKKPAPPAPSSLREKPFFVEKPSAFKIAESDGKLEKITIEKNSIERRLSSSSDKDWQPSHTQSFKINHDDKQQVSNIAVEKPQIPEKPNFDKKISPVDLRPSVPIAPIPLERHHIERSQMQTSSIDKNQVSAPYVTEEIPSSHEENKNSASVPEIILPSVESESDDDEAEFIPYRPRSPAPADRFDYYRPEWYGTEQDESENVNRKVEPQKNANVPKMIYLQKIFAIQDELEDLNEILESPKTETIPKKFNLQKAFVVQDESEKDEIVEFPKIENKPKVISPQVIADENGPEKVNEVADFQKNISEMVKGMPSEEGTFEEFGGLKAAESEDNIQKVPDYEKCNLTPHMFKKPSLSEEILVVGIPPHSIQFVQPSEPADVPLKGVSSKPLTISPDILGNLPFLSRKPTSLSEELVHKNSSSDHLDGSFTQQSLDDTTVIKETVPILKDVAVEDSSFSMEEIPTIAEFSTENSSLYKEGLPTSAEYDTEDYFPNKEGAAALSEYISNKTTKEFHEPIQVHRPSLSSKEDQNDIGRSMRGHYIPHRSETSKIPLPSSYSCDCDFEDEYGDHSESYTDSDKWSYSERSVSPECVALEQLRLKQHSLPVFTEYGISEPVCESLFETQGWPSDTSRTGHLVYQRPISPQSSQSVPYITASKSIEDEYRSSYSSLPRDNKPVDTWFSNNEEPVAKPRKSQKKLASSSDRPMRPALPPKLNTKPRRPDRPPPFVAVAKKSDVQLSHMPHSQNLGSVEIPFVSGEYAADEQIGEEYHKTSCEQSSEDSVERSSNSDRIRGSPAAPKRPPRPQPPPPPPPFKPRHNSASEDTHL